MLFRSITTRLVASYCLLLVVLGGAFLAFTLVSFRHYTRQTVTDGLSARTLEVWNVANGFLDDPQRLAEIIGRRFAPESQDRFIRIRAGSRILYQSGDPSERDFRADDVPPTSASPQARAISSGNLMLYTRDFQDMSGATITIDSGQSYQLARQLQDRLTTAVFLGLPILLVLAAIAGLVLMRGALTPVEAMISAAEAYSFNDAHKRLPLVGTDPRIEALGLALNRMLDRLDNAYTHVSRFSADAAHELRTPITIIRGELELAIEEAKALPNLDRAISNALEEMSRLSTMVDSLITLSRMESLWGKRAHANVDLQALAAETIDQLSLLAEEKHIALRLSQERPTIVAGDRDRLKQVLVNLVDNAIKYTPESGRIDVAVGTAGERAFILVEDTGIGIDPKHHERVFDRFYRVSTDRGEEGAGLGLAIVRSICHAHGGAVSLRSVPEMGSSFSVSLPLVTSNEARSPKSDPKAVAFAGPSTAA